VTVEKKSTMNPTKSKRPAAKKTNGKDHKDRKEHAARAGETPVTIDRRANHERRNAAERRPHPAPVAAAAEHHQTERRAKVNRRRQIDPTTCERDYSTDEIEFMGALDAYKRRSGRMFPTCSEVLEVIRSLGYAKNTSVSEPEVPATPVPVLLAPTHLPFHTPVGVG
jgi:hypothetical protein